MIATTTIKKRGRPKKKFPDLKGGIPTNVPFRVSELVGGSYKATLKSVGRTFKAEGKTLEEAIGKIKISGGAKAVSVLTVEKDGRKQEKILSGRTSHALFSEVSPTMKLVHLKKVLMLFDL